MNDQNQIENKEITALVLAGGRGSRLGGRDKGLVIVAGKPAVEHVLDRVRNSVGQVVISANRNLRQYERYGYPVVQDSISGFAGPLAGMLAGLETCETAYMLTLPVDTPLIHPSFPERMIACLEQSAAPACVAECANQMEPLFSLLRRDLKGLLADYLEQDKRSARGWMKQVGATPVDCSDIRDQFINLNDNAELKRFNERYS